jgi:hypothetical protein
MNDTIPRKCAVDHRDGFVFPDNPSHMRVMLDGDMLRPVITYDLDNQWVEVYKLDDSGRALHRDGVWLCERRYGDVKVTTV